MADFLPCVVNIVKVAIDFRGKSNLVAWGKRAFELYGSLHSITFNKVTLFCYCQHQGLLVPVGFAPILLFARNAIDSLTA